MFQQDLPMGHFLKTPLIAAVPEESKRFQVFKVNGVWPIS